jgi:outer membrane biosynthesis protein TonB
MTPQHDERQALHRENQRITGHLNGLASLKVRRAAAASETVTQTPTPMLPPPAARKQSIPQPQPQPQPKRQPQPTESHGFFDDFEADAANKPHTHSDGSFSLSDDSTAGPLSRTISAQDTGRMAASAEETSDENRRPAAATPQGEAINDILDGFNW